MVRKDAVSVMLQSMLSFMLENRPTAKQIVESEWMVKWVLPEFEKAWSTGRQISVDVDCVIPHELAITTELYQQRSYYSSESLSPVSSTSNLSSSTAST